MIDYDLDSRPLLSFLHYCILFPKISFLSCIFSYNLCFWSRLSRLFTFACGNGFLLNQKFHLAFSLRTRTASYWNLLEIGTRKQKKSSIFFIIILFIYFHCYCFTFLCCFFLLASAVILHKQLFTLCIKYDISIFFAFYFLLCA